MFATQERKPSEVQVIDFGLATKYLSDDFKNMTDKVGTIYTMAPQVLQGVYDLKCDMVRTSLCSYLLSICCLSTHASFFQWSVGVITYMLLSGSQPFWGPIYDMSWEKRRR